MRPRRSLAPTLVALLWSAGCSEPAPTPPAPLTATAPAPPAETKAKGTRRSRSPRETLGAGGAPSAASRPSGAVRDDL